MNKRKKHSKEVNVDKKKKHIASDDVKYDLLETSDDVNVMKNELQTNIMNVEKPNESDIEKCIEPLLCMEINCKNSQKYMKGGLRGKCRIHGGFPLCNEPNCTNNRVYRKGGVQGKCGKHGGYPICIACEVSYVRKTGSKCRYCNEVSTCVKRNMKNKEVLALFLAENGVIFKREVHVNTITLDFVIEMSDKRIIIQVDRNQHKENMYSLGCDLSRMTKVRELFATSCNVLWIRFNPNNFSVNGQGVGNVTKKKRHENILNVINNHIMQKPVEILYMYYDEANEIPIICNDTAFVAEMRDLLVFSP